MSASDPRTEKSELRARIRASVRQMTATERAAASLQACALLARQEIWGKAKTILFYAPLGEELDVWPLLVESLAAGKTVALPRFEAATGAYSVCQVARLPRDLQTGRFGVREPAESCPAIALNRLDLILVPGVAFDLDGRRLGRGKGYYDQLLATLHGPTCGVAFDQQLVSRIPVEPHDVTLQCILTPSRWHQVVARARF